MLEPLCLAALEARMRQANVSARASPCSSPMPGVITAG